MAAGQIECCWCEKRFSESALQGPAHNRCPHCGDPVVPSTFGKLALGQDFACKMGGEWNKISDTKAEIHDAGRGDKPCEFAADEVVYPF